MLGSATMRVGVGGLPSHPQNQIASLLLFRKQTMRVPQQLVLAVRFGAAVVVAVAALAATMRG